MTWPSYHVIHMVPKIVLELIWPRCYRLDVWPFLISLFDSNNQIDWYQTKNDSKNNSSFSRYHNNRKNDSSIKVSMFKNTPFQHDKVIIKSNLESYILKSKVETRLFRPAISLWATPLEIFGWHLDIVPTIYFSAFSQKCSW